MQKGIKTPRWYSSITFKDSIILGLLLLIDINIHGRDFCRGNRRPIHNLPFQFFNEYLEKIRKEKSAASTSLYRLKNEGIFNNRDEKININLNSKWWQDVFNLKFRFFTAPRKWDGSWTIVSYDIPESQKSSRRDIRNLLVKLGFVQLHRSVWLTINDVREYLQGIFVQFQPNLFCFKSKSLFNNKDEEIIKTLFKPHEIEDNFRKFLGLVETARRSNKESMKVDLLKKFPDLVVEDKGIPAEFFEDKLIRSKLWNKTRLLQSSIL